MVSWADLYKTWQNQGKFDPIKRKYVTDDEIEGAGVSIPDAITDIRAAGQFGGGSNSLRLRDTNEFVDLTSIANRQARYKEYERLRIVPEIETAITIFADEACVAGNTLVATPFGMQSIEELTKRFPDGEKFLVYCYDFKKQDISLGLAHHPRLVKKAKTIIIITEDGERLSCTTDHKILLRNEQWVEAGNLKEGDELMPFYRKSPYKKYPGVRGRIFPRIYTLKKGWLTERDFINEWRGEPHKQDFYKIVRAVCSGLKPDQVSKVIDKDVRTYCAILNQNGFSARELKLEFRNKKDRRVVFKIIENKEEDVYDLSVDEHENFCTNFGVVHNCQIGDNGNLFDVKVENQEIKKELDFLFFHPHMLNLNQTLWDKIRDLFLYGDHFCELVIDPQEPKKGILKIKDLPVDTMYRIETVKGKVVEFQQSANGPDYQSLQKTDVDSLSDADIASATAIRFSPDSIAHFKVGGQRKSFYPYGVSLIENARGPAHQLRLVEDAMLVYRLVRSAERKVFYIDTGNIPHHKVPAYIEQLKSGLRKRKTFNRMGGSGNSAVEERWSAPSVEDDFWLPIRPNTNTRIETLPGAANLDQIDDALYFRNKVFISMNFPKNYMAQEDPTITRVTLSSIDIKFARMIERQQRCIAAGLTQIAMRHLMLKGYPEELFEDLVIVMTPPSAYKEISQNEVVDARVNRASALKSINLFSDYDLMVDILKIPPEVAKEKLARSSLQKLQEIRLQVIAQNPQLMGIAIASNEPNELGTNQGGPVPDDFNQPDEENPEEQKGSEQPVEGEEQDQSGPEDTYGNEEKPQAAELEDPTEEDIKNYDLEISSYTNDIDYEELSSD